jgi:hypothetical protein
MSFNLNDFLVEYNELLSRAALEHKGKFAALASPTLNKQETVTFLYRDVVNHINGKPQKGKRLNPIKLRLGFIARLGLKFIYLFKTSLQFRIKSIPENCIYIRTWLVPRSIQNGIVRDDYFRQLIYDLSEENNVIVGFQPLGYGETLKQFKNIHKPNNFIIPIGLLSIFDIIKIFLNYIFSAKITLQNEYSFKEIDISNLLIDSLKDDYYKLRSFLAYLELGIAKKIKTFSPDTFLYIFENQAWENAYLLTFKDTEIKSIGYQSSGFSFRFLNFFSSKLDGENALYPDKVLTVGDNFTKALNEFGVYPIPVETFGALRFDFPVLDGNYMIEKPNLKIFNKILYAFPVHFYQYEKIIQDLVDVFGDTKIEVDLKFHPLYKYEAGKINLPDNFNLWNSANNTQLNRTYDLILFNDNSFGIEALIMGVKSYEYDINEVYDDTRLIGFDIYNPKIDKQGLSDLKNKILSNKLGKDYSKKKISKYISDMYKVYDGVMIENF